MPTELKSDCVLVSVLQVYDLGTRQATLAPPSLISMGSGMIALGSHCRAPLVTQHKSARSVWCVQTVACVPHLSLGSSRAWAKIKLAIGRNAVPGVTLA